MENGWYNLINDIFLGSIPEMHEDVFISETSCEKVFVPEIKDVVFNDPATVVFWGDGTKTIVKCQKKTGDIYSKETGLAMAIAKKALGNKGNFNNVFDRWLKS